MIIIILLIIVLSILATNIFMKNKPNATNFKSSFGMLANGSGSLGLTINYTNPANFGAGSTYGSTLLYISACNNPVDSNSCANTTNPITPANLSTMGTPIQPSSTNTTTPAGIIITSTTTTASAPATLSVPFYNPWDTATKFVKDNWYNVGIAIKNNNQQVGNYMFNKFQYTDQGAKPAPVSTVSVNGVTSTNDGSLTSLTISVTRPQETTNFPIGTSYTYNSSLIYIEALTGAPTANDTAKADLLPAQITDVKNLAPKLLPGPNNINVYTRQLINPTTITFSNTTALNTNLIPGKTYKIGVADMNNRQSVSGVNEIRNIYGEFVFTTYTFPIAAPQPITGLSAIF